jgi:hypothetical protein
MSVPTCGKSNSFQLPTSLSGTGKPVASNDVSGRGDRLTDRLIFNGLRFAASVEYQEPSVAGCAFFCFPLLVFVPAVSLSPEILTGCFSSCQVKSRCRLFNYLVIALLPEVGWDFYGRPRLKTDMNDTWSGGNMKDKEMQRSEELWSLPGVVKKIPLKQ